MKGINCRKKKHSMDAKQTKKNANPFYWDFFPSNNFIHWNIEKKNNNAKNNSRQQFFSGKSVVMKKKTNVGTQCECDLHNSFELETKKYFHKSVMEYFGFNLVRWYMVIWFFLGYH